MCLKDKSIKRLYLVLNVATHRPSIVGVVKQYPLYRQIYEDTKDCQLNCLQMERLGLKSTASGQYKLVELEIPVKELF